jgi:hypothetical protein
MPWLSGTSKSQRLFQDIEMFGQERDPGLRLGQYGEGDVTLLLYPCDQPTHRCLLQVVCRRYFGTASPFAQNAPDAVDRWEWTCLRSQAYRLPS